MTITLNPTTLLEQLALVFVKSGTGPTTNLHEFINYVLELDLNNPYIPIEEGVISMLYERDDATDNSLVEDIRRELNSRRGYFVMQKIGWEKTSSTY